MLRAICESHVFEYILCFTLYVSINSVGLILRTVKLCYITQIISLKQQ